MISLLRKLRKSITGDNKNTYLLYAVGEIFLVVVGILIALSIDNWNEQRKERLKEINYLQDIKSDLLLNLNDMESHIQEKKDDIESAKIIINYCENDTITNVNYFNRHNLNVQIINLFEEKNNTFNELQNSGQLSMISKKEIKNMLQDIDLIYRKVKFWEEHNYNDLRELVYPIYFQEVDLYAAVNNYTFQLSNGQQGANAMLSLEEIQILLKDNNFKNGFVLAVFNTQNKLSSLELIKEKSNQLIELIDLEINTPVN